MIYVVISHGVLRDKVYVIGYAWVINSYLSWCSPLNKHAALQFSAH